MGNENVLHTMNTPKQTKKTVKQTTNNASKLRSIAAGITLLVSSGLLNTLQAQDVVSKKELIKMEQEANVKLDPLFEDAFAYLYGSGVQEHINTEVAHQHIDKSNLDPKFLRERILEILKNSEGDTEKNVLTLDAIIGVVEDSVKTLLVHDYAKVAGIYIKHIQNHGNIVTQKNWSEGGDPYNRVALPREVKIDALMTLFGEKGLFGKKGSLGNTKVGKEFAEQKTQEIESILNESLERLISKIAGYRKSAENMTETDAVYRATSEEFDVTFKRIAPLVRGVVTEAYDEIFKQPTTK